MMLICSTDLKPTLGGFLKDKGLCVREKADRVLAGCLELNLRMFILRRGLGVGCVTVTGMATVTGN